jgi:Flp pilus assembly secretin CpaC
MNRLVRASSYIVFGLLIVMAAGRVAMAADSINVHVDQAAIVKMPENVGTLVVGNPLIADVAVQPGGLLIVTGKGYGATNLVALDRRGNVLMERSVRVAGPRDSTVVVYRGVERETYSCQPNCERRVTLGDSPNYFGANITQIGSRNAGALGSGQQQQPR